jgi:tetratricopeptide (TPR) repeat protein
MIVSALTGEKGALKQAQYQNTWGKDATTLEEYDFYLRGHEQLMKYAKEGIERSGEIWREGLTKFPGSPLLSVKLGWHHMIRAYTYVSDHPLADFKKAGEFVRRVLSSEHLSPQVARLAHWLLSYVLIQERDFDGALAAAERTIALAPHDMFVLSRLMMVLVQAGQPDQALCWADQVSRCDPGLGWSYNYGKGWAYVAMERFSEAAHVLKQTEFNDAHLLLAIAFSHLGQLADARAAVDNMMRINPAITLQKWRLGYSFRDPKIIERCSIHLIQAGLRER